MGTEIEHKFLVVGEAWRGAVTKVKTIRQGYLSVEGETTVRVRVVDDKNAFVTIKGKKNGPSRLEYEYSVPIKDGDEMLGLCKGRLIEKHRHELPAGNLIWEVDVFFGNLEGLVIAEIELKRLGQHFELPDWLGEEVTDDPRYYNSQLADFGIPNPRPASS
jgi:adenylate cyclase